VRNAEVRAVRVPKSAVAPKPRLVPSIVGQSCQEARRILEAAQLSLGSCEVGAATRQVGAGRINWQQPSAGAPHPASAPVVNARFEPPREDVPQAMLTVPGVIGLGASDAEQRIRDANLRPRSSISPVRPWHRVADQRPQGGARVSPGTAVELRLVARYSVPDLRGRSCDDARQRVLAAGLSGLVCGTEAVAGIRPLGRIHRQQPEAGTQTDQPVTVSAWTPLGRVKVPALVGLEEGAAEQALASANLVGSKSGPAATLGRVISDQSPNPGTEAAQGDVVKIRLALRVPAMNGRTCNDAAQLARQYGFANLDCRLRIATADQPLLRVFDQSPAVGTQLPAPQTLVAFAAQGIDVPMLVGLHLPQALQRLQALGLQGRPNARDGDRRVVRQAPAESTEVAPGTAVRLDTERVAAVPSVVGLTVEDGQRVLGQSEFRSRSDAESSPAMRRIVSQRPAANTKAAVGSLVVLATALEVIVPDTLGKPVDEARTAIEAAGLVPRIVSASPREGIKLVREQRPGGGARVASRSAVDLTLLTRVAVPDMLKQSCDEATKAAERVGLGAVDCQVETWLPFVIGTPRVTKQSLTDFADEGAGLNLKLQPPLAPTLAVVLSPLLALAAFMAWSKPPLRAADVRLRIVADPAPRVTIVHAPEDGDAHLAGIAWRVERAPVEAQIRAWADLDARNDRTPPTPHQEVRR
jgi:beta-lactam-binding protein with PASTA domain